MESQWNDNDQTNNMKWPMNNTNVWPMKYANEAEGQWLLTAYYEMIQMIWYSREKIDEWRLQPDLQF